MNLGIEEYNENAPLVLDGAFGTLLANLGFKTEASVQFTFRPFCIFAFRMTICGVAVHWLMLHI